MGIQKNSLYSRMALKTKNDEKLTLPTFQEETKLWKKNYKFVIGIDEVGRGAFAGPVTVGAVVFDKKTSCSNSFLAEINDSKLLGPHKRKKLSSEIKKLTIHWSITSVGVSTINKLGIGKATQIAFRKSVGEIQNKLNLFDYSNNRNNKLFLLADGFYIPFLRGLPIKNQKAIIKGDQKSISIAAASIIAKVHRDNFMKRLHKRFPVYSFAKNKGYGTKEHRLAIKKHGLSKIHRTSFSLDKFIQ